MGSFYSTEVNVVVNGSRSLNPIEVEITIDENAATGAVILPVEQAQALKKGDEIRIDYSDDYYFFIVTGFTSNFSLTDYYRGVYLVGKSSLYMNTRVQFPGNVPQQVSLFDNLARLLQYIFLGGKINFNNNIANIINEAKTIRELIDKMLDFLENSNTVVGALKGYRPKNIYGGNEAATNKLLLAFLQAVIYNGFPDSVLTVRDLINYMLQTVMYKMVCAGTMSWRIMDARKFVPGYVKQQAGSTKTKSELEEIVINPGDFERIERSYNALHPTRTLAYMTLDDSNSTVAIYPMVLEQAQAGQGIEDIRTDLSKIFGGVELTEHEKTFGTNVGPEAVVPVPFQTAYLLGITDEQQWQEKIATDEGMQQAMDDLKKTIGDSSKDIKNILTDVATIRWYELARGASTMRVTGKFNKKILPGILLTVNTGSMLRYSGQVYSTKLYWRADGLSYAQYELVGVRSE
jgi:hypothetical protein